MTLNQFIHINGILPADAIVMRKKFMGMVDHYVIYMGVEYGRHVFVANYTRGVREIPDQELQAFLQKLVPEKIDRFPGPEYERSTALKRARQLLGQQAYDYLANNCEHFKNWVHHGKPSSQQVDGFADGLMLSGFGIAAVGGLSEDKEATVWGLGIGALGLILKAIENRND